VRVHPETGRPALYVNNRSQRIVGMTDANGQAYAYGYDANANLTSVTYPDSAVRTYVYENTGCANALTGIVAGFLFYSLTNNERLRRKFVRERLRTIAEMNHHIRNSLQVITYATAADTDGSVELIRDSVERIEWALREVLPGHVPTPATPPQTHPHATLRAG